MLCAVSRPYTENGKVRIGQLSKAGKGDFQLRMQLTEIGRQRSLSERAADDTMASTRNRRAWSDKPHNDPDDSHDPRHMSTLQR